MVNNQINGTIVANIEDANFWFPINDNEFKTEILKITIKKPYRIFELENEYWIKNNNFETIMPFNIHNGLLLKVWRDKDDDISDCEL